METQKIVNLLNGSDNENSKFATKKWYDIDNESKGVYSHENSIKFLTTSLESSLCDYSDACVLVTGNIAVADGGDDTKVPFKNCAPFVKCITEINKTFTDEAEHINITIPMYNLIGYIDNYSDTSGRLWQFKKDRVIGNINLTNNNSSSFKYKSNLIGNTVADEANIKKEDVKIVVSLKYLSNFWRTLQIPLINCKVELSLRWNKNCVLSNVAGNSTFKITDAKLYVPVVTLSTEDNAKLSKLMTEGFKRSVYWNEYKVIPEQRYNANDNIRKLIDPSWQGINRN